MAIVNAENMTPQLVINQAIMALKQFRDALNNVNDYYLWSSSISQSDLTDPPLSMDPGTAQGLLDAMADAHAEYVNHFAGIPAQLPETGYRYGDSQNQFIGPVP